MRKKISIFKFQFSINSGFTLIELLVVMVVVAVVGSVVAALLFSTIRDSKKAESITTIRQNGNYVISQMQRIIRYGYLYTLTAPYTNECIPTGTTQTNNFDFAVYDSDHTTLYKYACTSPNGTLKLNGNDLIDTSTAQITSCQITCSQPNLSAPPVVSISFTISSNTSVSESIATVPFNTTVTMRNQK